MKLDAIPPTSRVPQDLTLDQLSGWLKAHEADHGAVIDGAEAIINWSGGPVATDVSVLYIHGFSASRQETAPVSDRVGSELGANVVYARLAGHGLSEGQMEASAEDWLQSVTDAWDIATRVGRQVIIIAVSTGAPLSVWLTQCLAPPEEVHSLLFMSPNFRIRNPFGFILTWPGARWWVPRLMGAEREWEPENERVAKYWTSKYSTLAVIEMQRVVDWVRRADLNSHNLPLATLFMENDPTINHKAAIQFHHDWQADSKALIEVTLDKANVQHVFTGAITAPHRVDWTVEVCLDFIRSIWTPPETNSPSRAGT